MVFDTIMEKQAQSSIKEVIPATLKDRYSNKSNWSQCSSSSSSSNDSAVYCADQPLRNSSSILKKHLLTDMSSSSLRKRSRNYSSSSASSSLSCISDKVMKPLLGCINPISQITLMANDVSGVKTASMITTAQVSPIKMELSPKTSIIIKQLPNATFSMPSAQHTYQTRHNLRKNVQKRKACSCDCTSTCTTLTVQHYNKKHQTTFKKRSVISKTKIKTLEKKKCEQPLASTLLNKSLPVSLNNKRRKSEVDKLYDSLHELEWAKNISPDNILQQINIRQAASVSLFGNSKKLSNQVSHNSLTEKREALNGSLEGGIAGKNILVQIKKEPNSLKIPCAVVSPTQSYKSPTFQVTLELCKEQTEPKHVSGGLPQTDSPFCPLKTDDKSLSPISIVNQNNNPKKVVSSDSSSAERSLLNKTVENKYSKCTQLKNVKAENDKSVIDCNSVIDSSLPQLTLMEGNVYQDKSPTNYGPPVLEPCIDFQDMKLYSPNRLSSVTRKISFEKCIQRDIHAISTEIDDNSQDSTVTKKHVISYLVINSGRRILKKYINFLRARAKIMNSFGNKSELQITSVSNTSRKELHCDKINKSSMNSQKISTSCTKPPSEPMPNEQKISISNSSPVQNATSNKVSCIYKCRTVGKAKSCPNTLKESSYPVSSELPLRRNSNGIRNDIFETVDKTKGTTFTNVDSLCSVPHMDHTPACLSINNDSVQPNSTHVDYEKQTSLNNSSEMFLNASHTVPTKSEKLLGEYHIDGKSKACVPSETINRIDANRFSNMSSNFPKTLACETIFSNYKSNSNNETSPNTHAVNATKTSSLHQQISLPIILEPPKPMIYRFIKAFYGSSYAQITMKSERLSLEALKELTDVLQRCSKNPKCRSFVLNGTGECFSLGLDLFPLLGPQKAKFAFELADAIKEFIIELSRFPKPVIAFVTGPAHGLGMTIITYADLTIACEDATFCMTNTKYGCVPEGGVTVTLPAAIGSLAASSLLTTGRCLTAQEAKTIRLIKEVLRAEEMPGCLVSLLKTMNKNTLSSVETTKTLSRIPINCLLVTALENESKFLPNMWLSPACQNAIRNALNEEKCSDSH